MLGLISNTIYAVQRGFQRSDIANWCMLAGSLSSILFLCIILQYNCSITWIAFGSFGIPVCIALLSTVWFLRKYRLIGFSMTGIHFKEMIRFFNGGAVILY